MRMEESLGHTDTGFLIRRILYYTVGIVLTTAFLSALVFLNEYLSRVFPSFSFWMVPFGVAIVAVFVGNMIWAQAKETDRLKYEFVTVAAHKLRTPLTRVRWIIPQLQGHAGDNKLLLDGISEIEVANNRLIELTNTLLKAAHTEADAGSYAHGEISWKELIYGAIENSKVRMSKKRLDVDVSIDDVLPKTIGDFNRLESAVEILVENAVTYTPITGSVSIAVKAVPHGVKVSVSDTGIGVSPGDQTRLFSSFFRTDAATKVDTEGVGLGLAIAKSIIEHHRGRIGMFSEGEGKGSTFWFEIPAA